ncbi:hypothetical protein NDU88_006570 [Pleurodeles waltl]|uniref:Uncharacterized protein n=1 Tax=Pleurodeles waltl TaxID=8319 RepID=A0AAV7M0J5_PLEWA|nr:hypothetical protein NDU88_006570 [Pleurodeles waltl]
MFSRSSAGGACPRISAACYGAGRKSAATTGRVRLLSPCWSPPRSLRASRSSARGLGPPMQLRVSQRVPHVLRSAAGRAASRNSSGPGRTAGPFCTTYFSWPPFTTAEVHAARLVHGSAFALLARLRFCNGLLGPDSHPRTPWVVKGIYP